MQTDQTLKMFEEYAVHKNKLVINSPSYVETMRESQISNYSYAKRLRKINSYKEKEALKIVRYIISDILQWTPEEACDHMNKEIYHKTKLDQVARYIHTPKDVDSSSDYIWIISKAFPNDVQYSIEKQILGMYDKLLNGEINKIPKKLFFGVNGTQKLSILLNNYISTNIPSSSIDELYKIFSNTAQCNKMMMKAKLYYAYKDFYDTPLEYLHESLGEYQDDFLYGNYQLKYILGQREIKNITEGNYKKA